MVEVKSEDIKIENEEIEDWGTKGFKVAHVEIKTDEIFKSEINIKKESSVFQDVDFFPEEEPARCEVKKRQEGTKSNEFLGFYSVTEKKYQELVEINTDCSGEREHHSSTIDRTKREGNKSTEDVCNYKCSECDDTFSDAFSLPKHVQSCNGSKAFERRNLDDCCSNNISISVKNCSRTFKCSECEFLCVRKDGLRNHIRAVHLKEKPFACNECNFSSSDQCHLSRHIRTVHKKEKFFQCSECAKAFGCKSNLRNHIISFHTMEKPFKCSECEMAYGRKSSLANHILSFHRKEKPFKCGDCSYSCISKSHLNAHSRAVHSKEKPFKFREYEKVINMV